MNYQLKYLNQRKSQKCLIARISCVHCTRYKFRLTEEEDEEEKEKEEK